MLLDHYASVTSRVETTDKCLRRHAALQIYYARLTSVEMLFHVTSQRIGQSLVRLLAH